MDFSFAKQDTLFLQMIREFAEKEVKPLAAEVDEQERFPMETVQKMARMGLMGIPIPTQYGGAGGTNIMYGMAVEDSLESAPPPASSFQPIPASAAPPSSRPAPRNRR